MIYRKGIKFSVKYITGLKQKNLLPKECDIAIVTNGILLDKDMAKFFGEYGVTVGLSLDGPEEINNSYRIGPHKNINVYKKTIHTYNLLKEYGVKTGLSVTLTPLVIQNFKTVLNFFVNELGIRDGINFNILHYNPNVPVDSEYFDLAAKCLIEAFKIFRKLDIYEERMMRKAEAFINRRTMFADCGVVGSQIVVAPDGRIGVCQDFVKPRTYFKGTVFDKDYDPIEKGLFEGWQHRSPLYMEQCFDCEALGICGGGCPASAELKTGNRWNIDERICAHSKLTLRWLIDETFKKVV